MWGFSFLNGLKTTSSIQRNLFSRKFSIMVQKSIPLIASIDQGTQSTRCIIFNEKADVISVSQKNHFQIQKHPGWCEHNPNEIWELTKEAIADAIQQAKLNLKAPVQIQSFGVTNQRETILCWSKSTGAVIHNAIVWNDTRTCEIVKRLSEQYGSEYFREKTGLPINTYFSAFKIKWMLENSSDVQEALRSSDALFGTIDTWLAWNLTKGEGKEGEYITDVTNASRTFLFDIHKEDWSDELLGIIGITRKNLPRIVSNCEVYGRVKFPLEETKDAVLGSIIGDQQASCVGHGMITPGTGKCTFGSGAFLLVNTGKEPLMSRNKLLTTVAFKIGKNETTYALEGSIASAGTAVSWLNDVGLIRSIDELEHLLQKEHQNELQKCLTAGDLVENAEKKGLDQCVSSPLTLIPSFSGLFAPYWRPDVKGVLSGISLSSTRESIVYSLFVGVACLIGDALACMNADLPPENRLTILNVDGGMAKNSSFMQICSDVTDIPLVCPKVNETTALGAALLAGHAVGYWPDINEFSRLNPGAMKWEPKANKRWKTEKQMQRKVALDKLLS